MQSKLQNDTFSFDLYFIDYSLTKEHPLDASFALLQEQAFFCDYKKILTHNVNYKDNSNYLHINALFRLSLLYSESLKKKVSLACFQEFLYKYCLKFEPEIAKKNLFLTAYLLYAIFCQENLVGPSFTFKNAEKLYKDKTIKTEESYILNNKRKHTIDGLESFLTSEFSQIIPYKIEDVIQISLKKFRSIEFQDNTHCNELLEFMEIDGESICKKTRLLHIFILLEELFTFLSKQEFNMPTCDLWVARLAMVKSKNLSSLAGTLDKKIEKCYKNVFSVLQQNNTFQDKKNLHALLYIEYGYYLLHFNKYTKSKKAFIEAQNLLGLNLAFTGKMGVRTKYQTFKTAHLVLEVHSTKPILPQTTNKSASPFENIEDMSQFTAVQEPEPEAQINDSYTAPKNAPRIVSLNEVEDNILHEIPVLDDAETGKILTEEDTCVLLGLIINLQLSNPMDDLLRNQITAFLNQILEYSKNWAIVSKALQIRSLVEFPKIKFRERSLMQLESLADQYTQPTPTLFNRISYIWATNFPSYIEFQKCFADTNIKMGLVMAGYQIFEKLDLFEDCIECLTIGKHYERATELCLKLLKEKPTPRILCCYGDLINDIKYYREAWVLSKKKYARAQRSLGRFFFYQNNFAKSTKHFEKAVAINDYNLNSWFMLGSAYLRLANYPKAIKAFGKVVHIDETQGEAWGNMGVCFLQLNKKLEAFSVFDQALKQCERSWKMWQNYLYVSLEVKKFHAFMRAIENLVLLEKKEVIEEIVLQKLVNIASHHVKEFINDNTVHQFSESFFKRLARLFEFLGERMPEKDYVWAVQCDVIYQKNVLLEESLKVGIITKEVYDERIASNLLRIYELRIKENQSQLKVGWENDKSKEAFLRIYNTCKKLIKEVKYTNSEEEKVKLQVHLDSLKGILQKNLSEHFINSELQVS